MRSFFILFASLSILSGMVFGSTTREEFVQSLPENQDDPHSRTKLIDIWTNAARKPLGSDGDEVKVRMISVPDSARIVTVRWISDETAIAQCENTSLRFLSFFIKENGKWVFVRQYKMGPIKAQS